MALAERYLGYLKHFGRTVPLAELAASPEGDVIGLRHDVDHDLDLALEMAYWEAEVGCRSTYFVLHTASYWSDPRLLDKCLQIQDFGHEIGLHINVLSEWWTGSIESAEQRLAFILDQFRQAGLRITGVSAHGDPLCYRHQFINYWCFSELKPEQPEISESGLSAEGVISNDSRFRVSYPTNGMIRRADGNELRLWSTSMKEHGLLYHATHLPSDQYFTDSGGGWSRSADPLTVDMSTGRFQVLMHPIHWQRNPRAYFFLSTARSGTKWLATILENASSTSARHEYSLNHRREKGEWVAEKRTGPGFTALLNENKLVRELLWDVREWFSSGKLDYAESNAYLEAFLPDLECVFPDSKRVFIARDPIDIVSSIMARGWYQTPKDDRHRPVKVVGWHIMCPFERACWYVRDAMEKLREECSDVVWLEKLAADKSEFGKVMKELGIAFYPRLAEGLFEERINRNKTTWKPYQEWSERERSIFEYVLGDLRQRLSYSMLVASEASPGYSGIISRFFRSLMGCSWGSIGRVRKYKVSVLQSGVPREPFSVAAEVEIDKEFVIRVAGERNAYVILKGSRWNKRVRFSGWKLSAGTYCSLVIKYRKQGGDSRVYALFYDRKGTLLDRRLCAFMRDSQGVIECEFRPNAGTCYIDLAVYMAKDDSAIELKIESVELVAKPI